MLTGADDGVGWRSDVQGVSLSRWQRIISTFPPSVQFFTLTPFSFFSFSFFLSYVSSKVVMVEKHLNLATPLTLFLLHLLLWLNSTHSFRSTIPPLPPTPSIHSMDSIPLTYLSNSLLLRPSPPSRLLGGSKFYEPSNRSLIQFTTTKEYRTQRCRLVATSLKG